MVERELKGVFLPSKPVTRAAAGFGILQRAALQRVILHYGCVKRISAEVRKVPMTIVPMQTRTPEPLAWEQKKTRFRDHSCEYPPPSLASV